MRGPGLLTFPRPQDDEVPSASGGKKQRAEGRCLSRHWNRRGRQGTRDPGGQVDSGTPERFGDAKDPRGPADRVGHLEAEQGRAVRALEEQEYPQ